MQQVWMGDMNFKTQKAQVCSSKPVSGALLHFSVITAHTQRDKSLSLTYTHTHTLHLGTGWRERVKGGREQENEDRGREKTSRG